uniref:Uncharacterized protein n=1 Tax=Nelumbo nucifera TaxID=4432 RepID=A0A822XFU6_NELNU|nr:TPA_asm: hypothetical protein HUJ06_021827 [Nelumbo nucifera]
MARIKRTTKGFVYGEGRKRRCGVSEIIGGEEAEEEAVFERLDALLGRTFKTYKFKALVNLAISRLAILENQRGFRLLCLFEYRDTIVLLPSVFWFFVLYFVF